MTETAPSPVEHRARRPRSADDLLDEPAFADATEHQVKTPDEPEPEPEPQPAAARAAPAKLPDGWDGDMEACPTDGKPTWTIGVGDKDDFVTMETVWRNSRKMVCGQWQPDGWWAVRNHGGQRLPYVPLGWRAAQ